MYDFYLQELNILDNPLKFLNYRLKSDISYDQYF